METATFTPTFREAGHRAGCADGVPRLCTLHSPVSALRDLRSDHRWSPTCLRSALASEQIPGYCRGEILKRSAAWIVGTCRFRRKTLRCLIPDTDGLACNSIHTPNTFCLAADNFSFSRVTVNSLPSQFAKLRRGPASATPCPKFFVDDPVALRRRAQAGGARAQRWRPKSDERILQRAVVTRG